MLLREVGLVFIKAKSVQANLLENVIFVWLMYDKTNMNKLLIFGGVSLDLS